MYNRLKDIPMYNRLNDMQNSTNVSETSAKFALDATDTELF